MAGGAKPSQADQGRDRGLLGDVGDRIIRTEQPPGQGYDHAPMPVSQAGEGLHVPPRGQPRPARRRSGTGSSASTGLQG